MAWWSAAPAALNLAATLTESAAREDWRAAYARQARQEGGVQAQIALEEGARVAARAATLAAASGGGITGSAQAVLDDLSRQSMFRVRSALYSAETDARFAIPPASKAGVVAATIQLARPLLTQWADGWRAKTAPKSAGG
jgi:hypothetical protein